MEWCKYSNVDSSSSRLQQKKGGGWGGHKKWQNEWLIIITAWRRLRDGCDGGSVPLRHKRWRSKPPQPEPAEGLKIWGTQGQAVIHGLLMQQVSLSMVRSSDRFMNLVFTNPGFSICGFFSWLFWHFFAQAVLWLHSLLRLWKNDCVSWKPCCWRSDLILSKWKNENGKLYRAN